VGVIDANLDDPGAGEAATPPLIKILDLGSQLPDAQPASRPEAGKVGRAQNDLRQLSARQDVVASGQRTRICDKRSAGILALRRRLVVQPRARTCRWKWTGARRHRPGTRRSKRNADSLALCHQWGPTGARWHRRPVTRPSGESGRGRHQQSHRDAYSTHSRDHSSRHKCATGTATPYKTVTRVHDRVYVDGPA